VLVKLPAVWTLPPILNQMSREPTTAPDGRPAPTALLAVVLGVGALAVLAAATGTAWDVRDRFGVWGWLSPPQIPLPTATPPAAPPAPPPPARDAGAWLLALVWALLVTALLVAAVVLWRVLRRSRARQDLSSAPVLPTPGTSAPDSPAPELQAGLGAARHLLDTVADPTDAVLAAWVALEQAADRSGVSRRPADTPTEFTASVLTATPADATAVTALLALYHRARFSTAGVGPDAVAAARRCLDALTRTWSSFSPEADVVRPPTGTEPPA